MSPSNAPLALDTIIFARGLRTPPAARPVLHDIDLDVIPGEIFAIVGRAGAGKTTLFESVIGLRPVIAERLVVCGVDPRRFPIAVKQKIGIAPRRPGLEPAATVGETMAMFAACYQRADPERALSQLQLAGARQLRVGALTPAQQQRLSLALAIQHDPVVLFSDEPTLELDPGDDALVWELLRQRRTRGRTSVITTNRLDAAARMCDRIAVVHGGRLIAVETPAAMLARSAAPIRVSFELLQPEIPIDALRTIDGVKEARLDRSQYVLVTRDGAATVRGVLRLLEGQRLRPVSLVMQQQMLEDVFLALTAGGAAE